LLSLSLSLSLLAVAYVPSPFFFLSLSQTRLCWENQGFLPLQRRKFGYIWLSLFRYLVCSFIFLRYGLEMGDWGWWECCLARGNCMVLILFIFWSFNLFMGFNLFWSLETEKALKVGFWGYPFMWSRTRLHSRQPYLSLLRSSPMEGWWLMVIN